MDNDNNKDEDEDENVADGGVQRPWSRQGSSHHQSSTRPASFAATQDH